MRTLLLALLVLGMLAGPALAAASQLRAAVLSDEENFGQVQRVGQEQIDHINSLGQRWIGKLRHVGEDAHSQALGHEQTLDRIEHDSEGHLVDTVHSLTRQLHQAKKKEAKELSKTEKGNFDKVEHDDESKLRSDESVQEQALLRFEQNQEQLLMGAIKKGTAKMSAAIDENKHKIDAAHADDISQLSSAEDAMVDALKKDMVVEASRVNDEEKHQAVSTKSDMDAHEHAGEKSINKEELTAEDLLQHTEAKLEDKVHATESVNERAMRKYLKKDLIALDAAKKAESNKLKTAFFKNKADLAQNEIFDMKKLNKAAAEAEDALAHDALTDVQKVISMGKNAAAQELLASKDMDQASAKQAALLARHEAIVAAKFDQAVANSADNEEDDIGDVEYAEAKQEAQIRAYFDAAHEQLVADLHKIQSGH